MAVVKAPEPVARPRSGSVARRFGYAVAAGVNLVLMLLTTVWPGWQAVPFLTPAAAEVVPLFVASLFVGMAVNIVNLIADNRVLWSIGELIGSMFAFAVALSLWQAFPFDFDSSAWDWTPFVRFFLAIVMFGCAVGVLVQIVRLLRMAFGADSGRD